MDSAKVLIFLGLVCVCWGKSLPALMRNPEDKLLKIQNWLEKLKNVAERQAGQIARLEAALQRQQHKVATLERQLDTTDTLFVATISVEKLSVASEEVIIFDVATVNPRGYYNPLNGVYTAPATGYYQFTISKRSNNYKAHFYLLVDGVKTYYHNVHANGGNPASSMTVNILLNAGQTVQVMNHESSSVQGTNSNGIIQSFFTGYLLYPTQPASGAAAHAAGGAGVAAAAAAVAVAAGEADSD